MNKRYFKFLNHKFPVDKKKYLLNLLSPTTKGTKYFEPKPPGKITKIQVGRIILQCHQILSIFKSLNISLKNKKMLDIGTGNGMVPRVMLEISDIKEALGTDPFLDGEHKTSWQKHDHDEAILLVRKIIKQSKNLLNAHNYKKNLRFENFSFYPVPIKINKKKNKSYKFKQLDAHKIGTLNKKFDIIYCKAIEHINNWENVIKNINLVSKKKTIVYFKHRSFFSYLGPHRYSGTFIPWGHLLIKDKEIKNYVKQFHKGREKDFLNFYFRGLSYPRTTVNEFLTICQNHGFVLKGIQIEKSRNSIKTSEFIKDIKNFWSIVWKNYPRVSAEEVLSGIYHIVLEKNS